MYYLINILSKYSEDSDIHYHLRPTLTFMDFPN